MRETKQAWYKISLCSEHKSYRLGMRWRSVNDDRISIFLFFMNYRFHYNLHWRCWEILDPPRRSSWHTQTGTPLLCDDRWGLSFQWWRHCLNWSYNLRTENESSVRFTTFCDSSTMLTVVIWMARTANHQDDCHRKVFRSLFTPKSFSWTFV